MSGEELSFYAGEYRPAVVALAEAVAAAGSPAHAAEEAEHFGLWDEFAVATGTAERSEPRPETHECVEAWTAGRDSLEALVATYAIESGQPRSPVPSCRGCSYGFEEGPATEYFSLHATPDEHHAAGSRELIEERLPGADEERLLEVADAALRGNWRLLDGVERAFGRGAA